MTQKYYQPNCFSVPVKFFIFNLRPNFISASCWHLCLKEPKYIVQGDSSTVFIKSQRLYCFCNYRNSTQHLCFYFNQRITQGVEIVWNQTADISLSASCHLFGYQSCHQLVPTGWGRDRVRIVSASSPDMPPV